MAPRCRTSIPLLILTLLILPAAVAPEPERPPGEGCLADHCSPEELALAKKLGLDLKLAGGPVRYRSVGEQTWYSPWVVEGTVQRIDEDLYGPYHTKVKVHVEKYLKGTGPTDITLNIASGRLYSQRSKGILDEEVIGEVQFKADQTKDIGARFILFLDKRRLSARGREDHFRKYEHGETEFRAANRYRINHEHAEADPEVVRQGAHPSYPYDEFVAEILRVAKAQAQWEAGTH
jgi:hypothetical protein